MVKYEEKCKDDNTTIVFRIPPYFKLILGQIQGGPNTTFMPFAVISLQAGHLQHKMTDEKLKCPTKDPIFVGQNVQRVAKSFREACYTVVGRLKRTLRPAGCLPFTFSGKITVFSQC